jgi:hypothetical protein
VVLEHRYKEQTVEMQIAVRPQKVVGEAEQKMQDKM